MEDLYYWVDMFWKIFELKLKDLVKLLDYNKVFDCYIGLSELFLFINLLRYLCLVEYNLYFLGDVEISEVFYE